MAKNRKSISKHVRFEVFKRDNFSCQYCGAHPPGVLLHIDHINAVANGGTNEIDNLITSCEPCNLGKGARDLKIAPQTVAAKAAIAAEKEEQLRGYQEILEAKRDRLENEMWRVADMLVPGSPENGMNKQWLHSIKMFIEKLGFHEALDAAEIANAKFYRGESRRWSYFCGVCWRKLRREQGEVIPP